ncbi:MAG: Maf family protein [Parvularculaceae bacterium]
MTRPKLILASGSAIRAAILTNAGLSFEQRKPAVDEAAVKAECAGLDPERTALRLAEAKALAVSAEPDGYVIGSDQILEFEGRAFDKAKTLEEAFVRLRALQGGGHELINAVAVARAGAIVYRRLDRPRLAMRALTDADIEAYLKAAGPDVLSSVGCYQVEGLGARLFERIDGDYFAVLGLSLFPLLGFLKQEGVLDYSS